MSNLAIATNIAGLNSHRSLKVVSERAGKSSEKLSSGFKINRSADDAAGLAISEKMRNQIKGLNKAQRNTEDGISLIQIADGAMQEGHEMFKRIRELVIQGANDTNVDEDREKIQMEIDQLLYELNELPEKTEFNEIKVLQGIGTTAASGTALPAWAKVTNNKGLQIQDFGNPISVKLLDGTLKNNVTTYGHVDFSKLTAANAKDLDGKGFCFSCTTCAQIYNFKFNNGKGDSVEVVGDAGGLSDRIVNIDIAGITDGAALVQKILETIYPDTGDSLFNHSATAAALSSSPATLVVFDNRDDLSVAPGSQSPRHGMFTSGLRFSSEQAGGVSQLMLKVGSNAYGENNMFIDLPSFPKIMAPVNGNVSVMSHTQAMSSLGVVDEAIDKISSERARMGAYQNRLEHTTKNLGVSSENLSAAESRIRDTDMAKEMMEFTKSNILSQAGMSMLAQANQSPNQVLTLIK